MAQTKSNSTKRSGRARKPQARSRGSSNGASRVEAARHTVEQTAKDAGQTVSGAASKAKVPLLAGGAALAGAAGGMALGAHQARRTGASHDFAKAAKGVGKFGAQMGHLASELQQTREAAGNGKHRSPIEIVLEGLTARRSRA